MSQTAYIDGSSSLDLQAEDEHDCALCHHLSQLPYSDYANLIFEICSYD
jgi:hypothetical protein